MTTIRYVHWEADGMVVGYLEDYPDYWTQGQSLDELKENLLDLYREFSSGAIPGVRKVDELVVS